MKVKLLPSNFDFIQKVIVDHNIVTEITLEQSESSGIGSLITMSWEDSFYDRRVQMTVEISGVDRW